MQTRQQKVLDRFIQVLSFLDSNQDVVPSATVAALQRQLADSVDAMAAYARTQARGGVTSGGATGVHAARQALRDTFMRQVATVGLARLRGRRPGDPDVPDAAQIFKIPATRKNSRTLISSAEAMVQAAMPYAATFAENGVDLRMTAAAAQALASSLEARDTAKRTRVGATEGIGAAVRDGHEAVRLLDVVVRPFIAGDGRRVAEWKLARRTAGTLNLGDPQPVPSNLLKNVDGTPMALPSPATPTAALGSGQAALLTAGEPDPAAADPDAATPLAASA